MTSSSWHGVPTVLMGNCGMRFAPVAPDGDERLAEMMESVEDIPRRSILDGRPWDWETYPQYLDAVERLSPGLNVVGLVGHCAVRHLVMGERSFTDEYRAIADGMNDAGGGLFQAVLDFDTKSAHEIQLLHAMAERAGDVLFSGGVGNDPASSGGRGALDFFRRFLADTRASVGRITSIAMTRPSGMLMGLAQVAPVAGRRWAALMALPTIAERLAALGDRAVRALVAEGEAKGLWYDPAHVYPLGDGDVPDSGIEDGRSVAARAAQATSVHDFPHRKGRLGVRAEGYAATVVNGRVVTRDGTHTGERPGRVLRRFARG